MIDLSDDALTAMYALFGLGMMVFGVVLVLRRRSVQDLIIRLDGWSKGWLFPLFKSYIYSPVYLVHIALTGFVAFFMGFIAFSVSIAALLEGWGA